MELLNLIEASDVVYRLGWTLLHVIWLGAAAGLLLAAALRLMKSRSSEARYAVACAALVAVLAVSVGTFFVVPAPERPAPVAAAPMPGPVALPLRPSTVVTLPPMPAGVTLPPAPPATVAEMPVVAETPLAVRAVKVVEPALPYIVMAWGLGVLVLSLWQLTGWMLVQRLRRLAAAVQEPALVESARRLAHAMRVSRPVRLLESALVRVPMVIGWLRPVILLPIGFATGLTSEQVQAVLAHELAHIRRHDYLINLLQVLVETLFFYHPAVWYISRRIRAERENCCDDMALAAGAERFSYAESLVLLARQSGGKGKPSRAAAAFLGATGRPSQLKSRIGRLVGSAESEGPSRIAWPAALMILVTFITAAAIVAGCLSGGGAAPPTKGEAVFKYTFLELDAAVVDRIVAEASRTEIKDSPYRLAMVSRAQAEALVAGVDADLGVLATRSRTVSGEWWNPGLAECYAYATAAPFVGTGQANVFLGCAARTRISRFASMATPRIP